MGHNENIQLKLNSKTENVVTQDAKDSGQV